MWKRIFKIFIILYLPLLVLSLALFLSQKNGYLKYYSHLQEREIDIKKEFFIDLFHTPIQNGNYWSSIDYPRDFDPLGAHSSFMEAYVDIIKEITDYDQFRYLDLEGKEIFRAERRGINSIEIGALQDKHSRNYYKQSIDLNNGQLYVSRINLNRENGKIEEPYKPVIRVAAPIYDIDSKKNRDCCY